MYSPVLNPARFQFVAATMFLATVANAELIGWRVLPEAQGLSVAKLLSTQRAARRLAVPGASYVALQCY